MHSVVEVLLWACSITLVIAHRRLIPEDAFIVERFDGDMPDCRERQVCADVFTFERDMGDGAFSHETRAIMNCRCQGPTKCGNSSNPLIFNETQKQTMTTCESASEFPICGPRDVAKEQHNIMSYVYYKINCVCPNNDQPSGFYNKMTETMYPNELTGEYREQALSPYSRSRFFKCREFSR